MNKKNVISIIYLYLILLVILFGFDRTLADNNTVYSNVCVFNINVNITMTLFIISIIVIALILLTLRKIKIDKSACLLLLRVPLYFIPLLYITGDFKIGVAYSIIQCFFSYFIGLQNDNNIFKRIVYSLFVFTIILGLQVFVTMIHYNIGFFSDSLKWYMIVPAGRSNYISCLILPSFYLVDIYLLINKRNGISFVYSIFIFFSVLGTGSKLGIILYFMFEVFKILTLIKKNYRKNSYVTLAAILIFVCFVLIFNQQIVHYISGILDKFRGKNVFYAREQVYIEGFKLFSKYPIFGRSAFYYYIYDASKAHNFILESLIQTGIVGTVIYLIVIFFLIRKIFGIKNDTLKKCLLVFFIGYLFQGLAEPNLFGGTSDAFFWIMAGLSISLVRKEQNVIKNDCK